MPPNKAGEKRNKSIIIGVVSGVATRGASFVFTLITVPMTLHYLGSERYGIWMTMISILAWLSVSDLGLANGLTPLLSAAIGQNKTSQAKQYISTTIWLLLAISGICSTIFAITWSQIDWQSALNVSNSSLSAEISTSILIAVLTLLFSLPLKVTQRVYLATQMGLQANLWQLATAAASVIGIFIATKSDGGLISLVTGYSLAQLLTGVVNIFWLFLKTHPHLRPSLKPKFEHLKHVSSMGSLFLLNQIATLIIFQKDSILISTTLNPTETANYNIVWQMFFFLNAINILASPHLSPAFGDAYAHNDHKWMRHVASRYILITFSASLLASSFLAVFFNQVLELWVGATLAPSSQVIYSIATLTVIMSIQWPLITLLNGTGRLRIFTIFFIISAAINIPLSYALIKIIGPEGCAISTIITTAFISLPASIIEIVKIINNTPNKPNTAQHKEVKI